MQDRFANLGNDPELLRVLYDVNPNLVFVKDRQGRFVFANKALADVYACTIPELIGKTDADFNPEIDEIEHFLTDDLKVMDTQQELFIAQESVTSPEGDVVWLQTTKRPLVNDDGSCDHLLGICVDITARVAAEQRELALQKRVDRYERLDSLGAMAGGIAHDLNNLLGPLVAYPDLIREATSDTKNRSYADQIQRSADHATAIIADLLTLARRGAYEAVLIYPKACIENFLGSAAYTCLQAAHPNIHVSIAIPEQLPPMLGSASHLVQVVMNLIKNGFEAAAPYGELNIKVTAQDTHDPVPGYEDVLPGPNICIQIRDTGVGISDEDQQRIFEPFFSTKRANGLAPA